MKTHIKWIVGICSIALLVGVVALLDKKPATEGETIKIGAALALTGDASSWGEMSLKGAQMAVEDLNAKGGIGGKKVELVVEDMKSTSAGSISAVQKLVSFDHINAILGPSWMDVYQGAQGITAKNLIMISPDAGVEAVNTPKVNENVFSMWYRSQPKAELLVKFLVSKNIKRLAVIHQNDSYYVDLGNRIEAEAKKNGITIVCHEMIAGGDADFKTLIAKIKADDPDMLFFSLYDQRALDAFFKNHSLLAPDLPMVTDEAGLDYTQNPLFAHLINGMHFLSARENQSFEKKFKEKYNGTIPKFGASTAYDTIMILAEALEKQPDDLVGYVKSRTFKTITFGDMKFDTIKGVTTNNETYQMQYVKDGVVSVLK